MSGKKERTLIPEERERLIVPPLKYPINIEESQQPVPTADWQMADVDRQTMALSWEERFDPKEDEDNVMGLFALIMGVFSILTFAIIVNYIAGILAIVFGIIQIVRSRKRTLAIAGILLGIMGILMGVGFIGTVMNAIDWSALFY